MQVDAYLGEIRFWTHPRAPQGWHLCDGSLLPIADYPDLHKVLGNSFGGDGTTNFALPDLRGRSTMHPSDQYPRGTSGGQERETLQLDQLPAHTHFITASPNSLGTVTSVSGNRLASGPGHYRGLASDTDLAAESIEAVGSTESHENMMPFLVVNHIIALEGTYPSR